MPRSELTLTLGDKYGRVTVATLIKALDGAIKALRSMEEELARSEPSIQWEIVKAKKSSPLSITIAARPNGAATRNIGQKLPGAYLRGIQQMEKNPVLPEHFTSEAASAVKDMVSTVEREGGKLVISTGPTYKVSPTPTILDNIDRIVSTVRKYVDFGTIEGMLQEVSIRGGTKIGIMDQFTNQWISCTISPEQLNEVMRYFGKRVAVSGAVRYSDHKPTSITIDEPIQLLRDPSELPQLESMPPIDITDGMPTEEYVRRMRDAQ